MRTVLYKIVDIILAIPMLVFGPLAWLVARMRGQASLSHRALELANVGVVRHHYYEPLIFKKDLKYPLDKERVIVGLDLNEEGQLRMLSGLRYASELRQIPMVSAPGKFGYQNAFFEQGDSECYYSIIRNQRPKQIIEVGAGHSTMMAQLAIQKNRQEDQAYSCRHRCVEPYENEWLKDIGVEVIDTPIESVPDTLIGELGPGDILFIDSSHVIRPQGDVLHLYLNVLGRVKPGVIIHIHDIFTPRDYPSRWVIDARRLWDEQYLLEAFLCFNRDYEVICAMNWLWHNHREKVGLSFPMLAAKPEFEPGSFWIRRV